jgi:hypothetical protein
MLYTVAVINCMLYTVAVINCMLYTVAVATLRDNTLPCVITSKSPFHES